MNWLRVVFLLDVVAKTGTRYQFLCPGACQWILAASLEGTVPFSLLLSPPFLNQDEFPQIARQAPSCQESH